jgi:hypothetical protein
MRIKYYRKEKKQIRNIKDIIPIDIGIWREKVKRGRAIINNIMEKNRRSNND